MAEESTNPPDGDLQNPPQNAQPAIENALQPNGNNEDTKPAKQEIPQHDYIPPNIIVNIPQTDNSEAKEANSISKSSNRISWVGMAINLLLFLITLGAFWQTKKSVDISKDSLSYTKSYAREKDSIDSVHQLTINKINQKKDSIIRMKDSINTMLAKNTFDLQKKSIASQQKSINDATNRYINETQPYLQIQDVGIDSFSYDHNGIYIHRRIVNMGNCSR